MATYFWIMPWLALAVSGGAAWVALRRDLVRGWRRVGPGRLAVAIAWSGLVSGVVALFLAIFLGIVVDSAFAAIHVSYVWLVAGPMLVSGLAAALLWRRTRWGGRRLLAGGLVLSLAPLGIGVYASFVEPYWLEVTHTAVPVAGVATVADSVRIVVLADLQTTEIDGYERSVLEQVAAARPDIIVLPGDFYHGPQASFDRHAGAFVDFFRALAAPHGVYACLGNIDDPARIVPLLEAGGVRVLRDAVVTRTVRGVRVALGGVDYRSRRNGGAVLRELIGTAADVRVALTHVPDLVLGVASAERVDLLIAGHTHGGQIQVPGIGPLATASSVPRSIAAGGLSAHAGQRIYVSRGVGMERLWAPPLRLNCRPELAVVDLVPAGGTAVTIGSGGGESTGEKAGAVRP